MLTRHVYYCTRSTTVFGEHWGSRRVRFEKWLALDHIDTKPPGIGRAGRGRDDGISQFTPHKAHGTGTGTASQKSLR